MSEFKRTYIVHQVPPQKQVPKQANEPLECYLELACGRMNQLKEGMRVATPIVEKYMKALSQDVIAIVSMSDVNTGVTAFATAIVEVFKRKGICVTLTLADHQFGDSTADIQLVMEKTAYQPLMQYALRVMS